MKKVRVRFAPSPPGYLHLSGARLALFNWLFARKEKGDFILRLDDAEVRRPYQKFEENLIDDLRWLKLEWSEGPNLGGPFGPYKRSLRGKIYQRYVQSLRRGGKAYSCYCRPEELERRRPKTLRPGNSYRYNGHCRKLSAEAKRRYEKEGRTPGVRFAVPSREMVSSDLVRGETRFDPSQMEDFIIVFPDGTTAPDFATVVDDSLMEITHVILGDDHLPRTVRQILLFEALGFPLPQFAHVSPLLGPNRKPLSDRSGETSIKHFREKGYLPEAIINYLALLGWEPPEGREILSPRELEELFSLDKLSRTPAVFDWNKLNWIGGQHLSRIEPERLANLALPFLKAAGILEDLVSEENFAWISKIMTILRERIHSVSEVTSHAPIFFAEDLPPENEWAARVLRSRKIIPLVQLLREKLSAPPPTAEKFWKSFFLPARRKLKLDEETFSLSLRVLITGRTEGPELEAIFPLIPLPLVQKRIENSAKRLKLPNLNYPQNF